MDAKKIEQVFRDTAYVHTGGSEEELKVANYLQSICSEWGLNAQLDPFEVDMATMRKATLTIDGKEIPCKGYFNSGSSEVEAPFYYLTDTDRLSLSMCKGKIVMFDGYLRYWLYHDILDNGAVGFITYDGNIYYADNDIDQRELRSFVSNGVKIPGVNINAKDAVAIIKSGALTAKITLDQDEYKGTSHNVILDLPGEIEKIIVMTAHYDTTPLAQGAYDNMSGTIGILALAKYFSEHSHRYSLRFIWCGSEERGLLGSKAYCAANEEALSDIELVVNVDMIGSTMGKFIACCTSETELVSYLTYMGRELGFQVSAYQDVYSSDSTPFSDNGIPSVSFARLAPGGTAGGHNRYDTVEIIKTEHMLGDIGFITKFVDRMANAQLCPVERKIPDEMKEKLDKYLNRKR